SPHSATPAEPALTLSGWDVRQSRRHQSHPDDCEFVAAAAKRYTSHFARVRAASVTKPAGCYKTPDRFVRFANRPAPGQREFPAGATKAYSEFCAFLRRYRHR